MLAWNKGYEIQIDDMGYNPDPPSPHLFDPLHQTGAIYALAPSSTGASKPAGQWNTFEIEATSTAIKVTLNGQLASARLRVSNEDRSSARIQRLRRSPNSNRLC
jgi:3-keto-disaccharide hydrolase